MIRALQPYGNTYKRTTEFAVLKSAIRAKLNAPLGFFVETVSWWCATYSMRKQLATWRAGCAEALRQILETPGPDERKYMTETGRLPHRYSYGTCSASTTDAPPSRLGEHDRPTDDHSHCHGDFRLFRLPGLGIRRGSLSAGRNRVSTPPLRRVGMGNTSRKRVLSRRGESALSSIPTVRATSTCRQSN